MTVMILGAADSGKTTLLRQLKIISDHGFSIKEKETLILEIWKCIKLNYMILIRAIMDQKHNETFYDLVVRYPFNTFRE
jgi:ABC-type phosphate/phosphonate transport system ATPase subunit